jgi:hypothetical protein
VLLISDISPVIKLIWVILRTRSAYIESPAFPIGFEYVNARRGVSEH